MKIFDLKCLIFLCFSLSLLSCASSPKKASTDPSRPLPFHCQVQNGGGELITIHFIQARIPSKARTKGNGQAYVFKFTRDGHPVKDAILFQNKKMTLRALIKDPRSQEVTLISSYQVSADFRLVSEAENTLSTARSLSSPGRGEFIPITWARCSLEE